MKKNECVNPVSVPGILRVTDGQTRVNLLSFNQFHHDIRNPQRFSHVFQRASSVAEAKDTVTQSATGKDTLQEATMFFAFNRL